MNYRKLNNLTGWVVGIIATVTYLMTMEATASYWDCGEFLSCAYKIEVGHSPGAPFFMLIQRMFGLLAGGNLQKVAFMINAWSAIASGLTILFLFWTITHLAKKLIAPGDIEPNNLQRILIMGTGIVGGLAYTYSDTFWFSAVEAEVYATSSLFTALTFWAMLKWEAVADNRYSDRWLVFIAYMIGLSVGVHLLNLLTIPTLAMIYYFRRYKATVTGTIIAFFIGVAILAFVQFGVLQYIPKISAAMDVWFVNSLHLPFDFGALFTVLIVVAIVAALIVFARRRGYYLLHTGMLCMIFIIIGFSCYLIPMIRSRADVPIDMQDPSNANNLLSYLSREQFGQQPLVFGPDFDSNVKFDESTGNPVTTSNGARYAKSIDSVSKKGYYEVVGEKVDYVWEDTRFFPRMWDNNDEGHAQFYADVSGINYRDSHGQVIRDQRSGKISFDRRPTAGDNLNYFLKYQMNWMWWRYFMWNFAGRQNDMEGQLGASKGNWISGIKPIDKLFGRGDIDKMADGYRNNGARNELYFLPLILGIAGMVYQFKRSKKDFTVILMLFFFTGIAIGIYLNMTPLQPRERDYAFAGCTYAFAIWIGLGVLMVYDLFNRAVKGSSAAFAAIGICLLAVPVLMASKEWDDHNRSHKTLARATAYNTLESCAQNAVLFTYGDNETYPLWYLQEIEGIRTDVRVINTSLLGIDWYIDQLNYKINNADAVPMVWKREDYLGDRRNYVRYLTKAEVPLAVEVPKDQFIPLVDVMRFMSDPKNALQPRGEGEPIPYFPTKNFYIATPNKAMMVKDTLLSPRDSARASTDMRFTVRAGGFQKGQLAQLNIIAGTAAEGWKRPVYFSNLQEMSEFGNLTSFMRLEGTVYRLMPYQLARDTTRPANAPDQGNIDVDKSLNLFTKTYLWGNADKNDVFFDETNRRSLYVYRINGPMIADELSAQGRSADAVRVLDMVMKGISEHSDPYDFSAVMIGASYYRAGAKAQAAKLSRKIVTNAHDNVRWMMTLSESDRDAEYGSGQIEQDVRGAFNLFITALQSGDTETANWIYGELTKMTQETQSVEAMKAFMMPAMQQMQQLKNSAPPALPGKG